MQRGIALFGVSLERRERLNDDFCYLALAIVVVVFGWRHVVMGYRMGLDSFRLFIILFLFNLLF